MVSGSFAKYVTSDSIVDYAKVAEFGVKVEASGQLFSDTYLTTDNTPGTAYDSVKKSASNTIDINDGDGVGTTLSVVSKGVTTDSSVAGIDADKDNKLVAPGTKNDEGITFSITGKTETAVKIVFTADGSDVYLGKGTYPNMTNGDVYDDAYVEADDTFKTTEVYYPIKYTLSQGEESVKTGTLSEVVAYLNALNTDKGDDASGTSISANTDLGSIYGTYTLTWAWDFDAKGQGTYDKQDTLLGELASSATNVTDAIKAVNDAYKTAKSVDTGILTAPVSNASVPTDEETGKTEYYNLTPNFDLTISVTQID
jgi:uncharacterized protein